MSRIHDLDTTPSRATGPSSLYDGPDAQRTDVSHGEAAAKRRPMHVDTPDGRQVADADVSLFRDDNRKF